VVKWFEVGILSQQSGFDSCPGKPQKKRPTKKCVFNKLSRLERRTIKNKKSSLKFLSNLNLPEAASTLPAL